MTFRIKTRGARTTLTLAEYACPDHGRFELLVERDDSGDPPATVKCAHVIGMRKNGDEVTCGMSSSWTISAPSVHTQFVVSATRGKNDPKPHKYAMDTRMLVEGRKKEFRQQRKKVREELRHQRVKALLE